MMLPSFSPRSCKTLRRACALVRFPIPNISQPVATGWPNARNLLHPKMLRFLLLSNVVIVWPELVNAGPTMLGCVVLKCCHRLAGSLACFRLSVCGDDRKKRAGDDERDPGEKSGGQASCDLSQTSIVDRQRWTSIPSRGE